MVVWKLRLKKETKIYITLEIKTKKFIENHNLLTKGATMFPWGVKNLSCLGEQPCS
jgi:hypothetical protein